MGSKIPLVILKFPENACLTALRKPLIFFASHLFFPSSSSAYQNFLLIPLTMLCLQTLPEHFCAWLKELLCLLSAWPRNSVGFDYRSQKANLLFHSYLPVSSLYKEYSVKDSAFQLTSIASHLPQALLLIFLKALSKKRPSMTPISFHCTPKHTLLRS